MQAKLNSLIGRVVNQLDAPFSLARSMARWRLGYAHAVTSLFSLFHEFPSRVSDLTYIIIMNGVR